jgi:hypothetical protein
MIKKIIVIFLFLTLVFAVVNPAQSYQTKINKKLEIDDSIQVPMPGDMKNDILPNRESLAELVTRTQPEKRTTIRNDDIATLISQLDEDIYLGFLEDLVAFGPRVSSTPACEDAAEYIYNEFVNMGLETRYHSWEDYNLYGDNVEAILPGIDETSDEIYVICAHYDSVPGSPGADDDGSGTVAVMSAAYLMRNYAFNHTIKFVTFSGEEQGLYGSYYYVQEAVENDYNIAGVLNLDMIGFALSESDEDKIRVFEGDFSQDLLDLTTDVSGDYTDIFDLEVIPSGYSRGSDHYYFWQAGYNAIFYIEHNFNDYYHSPDDIIEHMNIGYAVEVTQLAIGSLAELAEITIIDAPEKPDAPKGEINGEINIEYKYTAVTTDLQDDQIYYLFDWDEETDSGWLGPFDSGVICEAKHIWIEKGEYDIRVKAKDIYGHESDWSDLLSVSMPKTKIINSPFLNFLENHPHMFPILIHLLGL